MCDGREDMTGGRGFLGMTGRTALKHRSLRASLPPSFDSAFVEGVVENGGYTEQAGSSIEQTAKEQLKSFVERIERLEEEKAALSGDIRDLYAEAKSTGFDTKALRKLISLRKKDANERQSEEAILATYMHALGMLAG